MRTDTVIADRDNHHVVNRHFRQIYLQFPYFTKGLEECETLYGKLMYTLKNMNNWNRMPDALKEQVFSHLERLAAVANLSEANRLAYDKAVDRYNVSRIVENDIREKAMTEGVAKGIEKGIEKGRAEGYKEVARKLKAGGASVELIIQATGFSAEEIAKL